MQDDAAGDGAAGVPKLAGLVAFVFGASRVPLDRGLPGPVLIHLLGDLGVSAASARAVILRMRHAGWLRVERQGRVARYLLGASLSAATVRMQHRLEQPATTWEGGWFSVLYHVPESQRAYRDALRRAAALAGYGLLQPGVLVAPDDQWAELGDLPTHAPPGSQVVRAELHLSLADSRRIAEHAWNLGQRAERYRLLVAALREQLRVAHREQPQGAEALRRFEMALRPVLEAVGEDPGLPTVLLPAKWPLPAVAAAVGEGFAVLGPPVVTYVAGLLSRFPSPGSGAV